MSPIQETFPDAFNRQSASAELSDQDRIFRVKFILVISVGGLLGVVGNGLLLCFYGNRQTRTYRSRDAIYIRRMALTDFLICALVIPYAVLFEAELITTDVTCKTMEFVRHFLIYMSHLLLYTYAWELPQRHLYTESKTYNLNTCLYSIMMSVLGAAPTLFIFRVSRIALSDTRYPVSNTSHSDYHHHQHSQRPGTVESSRAVCRFVKNIDNNVRGYDVKSLTWIYVIIPVIVYSMCLYWFFINLAHYLNTCVIYHRNSIFMTNLEDILQFERPPSIQNSKQNSLMALGKSLAGGKNPQIIFLDDKPDSAMKALRREDARAAEQMIRGSLVKMSSVAGLSRPSRSDRSIKSYQFVYDNKYLGSAGRDADSGSSVRTASSSGTSTETNSDESGTREKRARLKAKISILGAQDDGDEHVGGNKMLRRRGTGFFPRLSDLPRSSDSLDSSTGTDIATPPNSINETRHGGSQKTGTGENKFKEDRKLPYRSILTRKQNGYRLYPRVGSYKKSLAALILLDLLIVPLVMIAFLLTGGNSAILNLTHLKSMFSFYVLSVLSPYLRSCVWGRERCVCFPPASNPQAHTSSVSLRPSMLQVSFVRERFRRKQAERKLRHLQQRRANDGTEIS